MQGITIIVAAAQRSHTPEEFAHKDKHAGYSTARKHLQPQFSAVFPLECRSLWEVQNEPSLTMGFGRVSWLIGIENDLFDRKTRPRAFGVPDRNSGPNCTAFPDGLLLLINLSYAETLDVDQYSTQELPRPSSSVLLL